MEIPDYHVKAVSRAPLPHPVASPEIADSLSSSSASGQTPDQPRPKKRPAAAEAKALTGLERASRVQHSLRSRVFFAGFGLSFLLLILEYLTAGEFPGWFILVPSNPTTLLAALFGHKLEPIVGSRWSDEAFFGTLVVESALWWFVVGALVAAGRRRARRSKSETERLRGMPGGERRKESRDRA
jgi:hypothetical protein